MAYKGSWSGKKGAMCDRIRWNTSCWAGTIDWQWLFQAKFQYDLIRECKTTLNCLREYPLCTQSPPHGFQNPCTLWLVDMKNQPIKNNQLCFPFCLWLDALSYWRITRRLGFKTTWWAVCTAMVSLHNNSVQRKGGTTVHWRWDKHFAICRWCKIYHWHNRRGNNKLVHTAQGRICRQDCWQ